MLNNSLFHSGILELGYYHTKVIKASSNKLVMLNFLTLFWAHHSIKREGGEGGERERERKNYNTVNSCMERDKNKKKFKKKLEKKICNFICIDYSFTSHLTERQNSITWSTLIGLRMRKSNPQETIWINVLDLTSERFLLLSLAVISSKSPLIILFIFGVILF